MNPSAVEAVAEESGDSLEEQILVWLRIASELVALVYLLDVATNGALRYRARYEWERFLAPFRREKEIKAHANHLVFEAIEIVEDAA